MEATCLRLAMYVNKSTKPHPVLILTAELRENPVMKNLKRRHSNNPLLKYVLILCQPEIKFFNNITTSQKIFHMRTRFFNIVCCGRLFYTEYKIYNFSIAPVTLCVPSIFSGLDSRPPLTRSSVSLGWICSSPLEGGKKGVVWNSQLFAHFSFEMRRI